jgi:XTP/dITP diphosphohydrolase
MAVMIVLLLDARWPTMIPFPFMSRLNGILRFTDEVPIAVRWNLGDALPSDAGTDILVSTNEFDSAVKEAIEAGAKVWEVDSRKDSVGQAVHAMERALRFGEWEQGQTHESLIPYLQEETAEFIEAVEQSHSEQELCSELGDLFLQVLFHAEIASRRGAFDFQDVAQSFVNKLRSRSPYFFDGSDRLVPVEEQEHFWALGKENERKNLHQ